MLFRSACPDLLELAGGKARHQPINIGWPVIGCWRDTLASSGGTGRSPLPLSPSLAHIQTVGFAKGLRQFHTDLLLRLSIVMAERLECADCCQSSFACGQDVFEGEIKILEIIETMSLYLMQASENRAASHAKPADKHPYPGLAGPKVCVPAASEQ